jgi:hypothetical protein
MLGMRDYKAVRRIGEDCGGRRSRRWMDGHKDWEICPRRLRENRKRSRGEQKKRTRARMETWTVHEKKRMTTT